MNPNIGIDLGTTRSVIATLDATDSPTVLTNAEGDATTPSAVYFDPASGIDATPIVGAEAIRALSHEPDRVVRFAKRYLGRPDHRYPCGGRTYSPTQIQSFILQKLRNDAAAAVGAPIESAVVTVPAFFNDPRRRATIESAGMAGIEVSSLLSEPTAAALAHCHREGSLRTDRAGGGFADIDKHVMVYDLGGGTFDVSMVHITPGDVRVVAVDGNSHLGGLDWDRAIAQWLLGRTRLSEADIKTLRDDPELLAEAEQIKHSLTVRTTVPVKVAVGDEIVRGEISRDEFETATAHLLDRTRFTAANLIKTAGLKPNDLDRILLVGGSTRMPAVHEMLSDRLGIEIDRGLPPDTAVAMGAALYAGLDLKSKVRSTGPASNATADKTPNDRDDRSTVRVTDVCAHDLGVLGMERETRRPLREVMIPRNQALPAMVTKRFSTARPGQRRVRIRVVEGGDRRGDGSSTIGDFFVGGLPKDAAAGTPIRVTFRYDSNGILSITAKVDQTDIESSITVQRPSSSTDETFDDLGLNDTDTDLTSASHRSSNPTGNETTGNEPAGNETAGNETTGDEADDDLDVFFDELGL